MGKGRGGESRGSPAWGFMKLGKRNKINKKRGCLWGYSPRGLFFYLPLSLLGPDIHLYI